MRRSSKKKRNQPHTIGTLVFITVLTLGKIAVEKLTSSFEQEIKQTKFEDKEKVSFMIHSLPTIIAILFNVVTGFAITSLDLGLSTILIASLPFFSNLFLYLSLTLSYSPLILISSITRGMALDSLFIIQILIIEKMYFEKKKFTLVFGLVWVVGNVATLLMPKVIFNFHRVFRDLEICFVISGLLCFLSFIASVYIGMDLLKGESKVRKQARRFKVIRMKTFQISDFCQIPSLSWTICLTFSLVYLPSSLLLDKWHDIMEHRLSIQHRSLREIELIQRLQPLFLVPLFSFLSWKIGKKDYTMLVAVLVLSWTYYYFLNLPEEAKIYQAIVAVSGTSISSSMLVASVIPSLISTLPKNASPVVLGMIFSFKNLTVFIFQMIIAGFSDKEKLGSCYQRLIEVVLGISVLSILSSTVVIMNDIKAGGVVNASERGKRVARYKEDLERKFYNGKDGWSFDNRTISLAND